MPEQQSPRWARLKKTETVETPSFTVDIYRSPLPAETLIEKHLDEAPVLYNFAVFDKSNRYLLSYTLEIRRAVKLNEAEEDVEYTGYFLETYCPYRKFSCKNFKDTEPPYDLVKSTVLTFINEYDAVPKMLEYDLEAQRQSRTDSSAATDVGNAEEN